MNQKVKLESSKQVFRWFRNHLFEIRRLSDYQINTDDTTREERLKPTYHISQIDKGTYKVRATIDWLDCF